MKEMWLSMLIVMLAVGLAACGGNIPKDGKMIKILNVTIITLVL